MGNRIEGPDRESAKGRVNEMSNGLTSVVIGVLSMATSAESASPTQQLLASVITTRDQSIFGSGVVGFNLCEMPWNPATFTSDRDWLIRCCDRAASGVDWNRLGYEPNAEWVLDRLDGVKSILREMTADDISPTDIERWGLVPEEIGEACSIHQVLLHSQGCILCND